MLDLGGTINGGLERNAMEPTVSITGETGHGTTQQMRLNGNIKQLTSSTIDVLSNRYDWMRNEPNDFRSQDCLTFLKDQDLFGFGVWHWNDWSCSNTAGYICERDGATF